eukprot:6212033-Pleurochrysis_carterae.AAC.3
MSSSHGIKRPLPAGHVCELREYFRMFSRASVAAYTYNKATLCTCRRPNLVNGAQHGRAEADCAGAANRSCMHMQIAGDCNGANLVGARLGLTINSAACQNHVSEQPSHVRAQPQARAPCPQDPATEHG